VGQPRHHARLLLIPREELDIVVVEGGVPVTTIRGLMRSEIGAHCLASGFLESLTTTVQSGIAPLPPTRKLRGRTAVDLGSIYSMPDS
jgi:hypothetical protein